MLACRFETANISYCRMVPQGHLAHLYDFCEGASLLKLPFPFLQTPKMCSLHVDKEKTVANFRLQLLFKTYKFLQSSWGGGGDGWEMITIKIVSS